MADEGTADVDASRGGFGSLGTAIGALVAAWAAIIASFPLNDNSFFTHLATGRIILDGGSVPSSDPYTSTASGVDWTVQSWLPSVVYAAAERAAGVAGLRLLVVAVLVLAAMLVWRLSRAAISVVPRLLIVAGAMFVASGMWGERPYMVGVIGVAVVLLALDGAVRPWLLVPFLWIWANSHGSYPLAFVLIVLVIAGTLLDRRGAGASTGRDTVATELRVLGATALGTLLAVIGPLGFEVLTFPLKAVTQSEVLARIVEWQPPQYRSLSERMFLVLVLATMLALARGARWRVALPAIAFVGAGLYTQRNIVMATMVLVPVLAAAAPRVGSLTSAERPGLGPIFSAFTVCTALLAMIVAMSLPMEALEDYPPAEALSWLDRPAGAGTLTDETTGNLLEALDGPTGTVFIDDRADMFPSEVVDDYLGLLQGAPGWESILDEHHIDRVVWERSRPLASLLATSSDWSIVFADTKAVVACRRATACDEPRR